MPHRVISRRNWLELTALTTVATLVPRHDSAGQTTAPSLRETRIRRIVREFEEQGFHRTGTSVDRASANWLRDLAHQSGLTASLESFSLHRVDPVSAALIVGGRRIEGIPLFDAAFTNERGVAGRLGLLDSDAEIGLAESRPNAAGAGPLGDARRANRHRAIVCVTRGSSVVPRRAPSTSAIVAPNVRMKPGSARSSGVNTRMIAAATPSIALLRRPTRSTSNKEDVIRRVGLIDLQ